MLLDNLKLFPLKYEVVDDFLTRENFKVVTAEGETLHQHASHNVFAELSRGKTTVRSLDESVDLLSPQIILSALTSDIIKSRVKKLVGFETNIFTLLDFTDKAGHSFFHRMFPGSFLGLHVDRSYLPGTSMVKVANALLYTADSWDSSYGGNLYLRNGLFGGDSALIDYKPNRLVLLFHTSRMFHGVSQLSVTAPVRYSSYMDFYVEAESLRGSELGKQFWRHETVYLPEIKRIHTFLRGKGYTFQLIEYLRRKGFSSQ